MKVLKNKYTRNILPAVLSLIIAISGNAIFSLDENTFWKNISIIALILCSILDIILIMYYVSLNKEDDETIANLNKELNDCKLKNDIISNQKESLDNVLTQLQKCFDTNAEKLYQLLEHTKKEQIIDLKIWNKKLIFDFACNCLFLLITQMAEKGDSFSVSVIIPKKKDNSRKKRTEYIMLSYDGKDKQKPHIYNQPIAQKDAGKYYYGKLFKKNNPEISYLMTPHEIDLEFYFTDPSKRGKYEQYIGIPICCDGGKMIGLLQVVADKGSVISSEKNKLKNLINQYMICFSSFILFADKIEKGVALEIH